MTAAKRAVIWMLSMLSIFCAGFGAGTLIAMIGWKVIHP